MTPNTIAEEGTYGQALPDDLPPPDVGEIIMRRSELGRSRKPWLKDATYYIYTRQEDGHGNNTGWWGPNMNGYSMDRRDAGPAEYQKVMGLGSSEYYYLYVKTPEEPAKPGDGPKRRCNIISMVGPTVMRMITLQPKNETFRAKLMAALGEMPPKEADTFEKLKDWVEFNFPKTKPMPKDGVILKFKGTFNRYSNGKCRYTATRFAESNQIELRAKDIEDALKEAGDDVDFDDLISGIAQSMQDRMENSVNYYGDETVNTESRIPDEEYSDSFDYPLSEIRKLVRAHIIANMEPSVAENLGIS